MKLSKVPGSPASHGRRSAVGQSPWSRSCLLAGSQSKRSYVSTVQAMVNGAYVFKRFPLCLGLLAILSLQACELPEQEAIWIRIPPGDPVEAVAESLAAHNIVRSARAFERFARMGKKHLGIKPGVYAFHARTPMGKVLALLREGRPDAKRIRVKEGVWLSEIIPVLGRTLDIPVDSLKRAVRDSALRAEIGTTAPTVEGYLYPTTYYVPVDATPLEVVRQMVDTFEARWEPQWDDRLEVLGFTRHEIVTLASIIEGEDPLDLDRPLVSSVYHNRLARNQRLQADPTVVYALGRRGRLYNKHYEVKSAFNTYRVNGLPPGPICQPSNHSILAALFPPETDYYYFVANAAGQHVFSRSYREHLNTIRTVRAPHSAADSLQ